MRFEKIPIFLFPIQARSQGTGKRKYKDKEFVFICKVLKCLLFSAQWKMTATKEVFL